MEKTYNYILLLKKSDIIDLFKFGYLNAYCPSVSFDGDIMSLSADKKKAGTLFKNANPFEYSIEYYLVHIQTQKKLAKRVTIDNVIHIYALDDDSLRVGLNLNPPIRLEKPIWKDAYEQFQIGLMVNSAMEGVSNVFNAFKLTFDIKRRGFISNKDIKDVFRLTYNGLRPNGKLSIWTYLLMYERHHNYPKDTRGFFLDSLHAYANFMQQKEIDAPVSQSRLGSQILACKENAQFKDILKMIDDNKDVASVNKTFKGFFCVASLFLLLKKEFEDGLEYGKLYYGKHLPDLYSVLKLYGEDELKLSLYLLGLTLGWENTYKYIYQSKPIPVLLK